MKREWLAAVVLLLVGWWVFTAVGIYRYGPDEEDGGDRGSLADAAIVLGAAVWEERPMPRQRRRPVIAVGGLSWAF